MISAQQAALMHAHESKDLQLHFVYEDIANAARKGLHCITYKNYLGTKAVDELQQQGYQVIFDECDRGTSFWVISWKHACM